MDDEGIARLTGAVAAPGFFAGPSGRSAFITFAVVVAAITALSPSAGAKVRMG